MEGTLAYSDGQFAPVEEMSVGVRTHALHYGTGVFEGIRAYWNADVPSCRSLWRIEGLTSQGVDT